MGLQIDDGKGNGCSAGVSCQNRLLTEAITFTTEHHSNHTLKSAYNLIFSATPSSSGDCFLYFKNESETDLVIEGMKIKLAADEYIDLFIGDTGVPATGTDIVPANLNSSSALSAEGTFQNGNDITGLSGGTKIDRIYHASSLASMEHNFEQDIILPKNGVFTMYIQTGTVEIAGTLYFNYHGPSA